MTKHKSKLSIASLRRLVADWAWDRTDRIRDVHPAEWMTYQKKCDNERRMLSRALTELAGFRRENKGR